MQTLISVFDDRATARRAIERLVKAGFPREDMHLEESGAAAPIVGTDDAENRAVGDRTMATAEREIAVDRHAMESAGHFFVNLFGLDDHDEHTGTYSEAVKRGHPVLVIDAQDDDRAEAAAMILHDVGAIDVDDRAATWRADGWDAGAMAKAANDRVTSKGRVRYLRRDKKLPLRDLVARRHMETHE